MTLDLETMKLAVVDALEDIKAFDINGHGRAQTDLHDQLHDCGQWQLNAPMQGHCRQRPRKA
jgi:hypothetical protein